MFCIANLNVKLFNYGHKDTCTCTHFRLVDLYGFLVTQLITIVFPI